MRPISDIDDELWIAALVRAACRHDGEPLPSIERVDRLLDERNAQKTLG